MQSQWGMDQRENPYNEAENFTGCERSTSAPPPETNLLFRSPANRSEESIFGSGFLPSGNEFLSSSSDHSQYGYENQSGTSGYDRNHSLHSSSSMSKLPFIDRRSQVARSQQSRQQIIGESVTRPHSATPSVDSHLSVGLPPGFTSRQETPTHSNQTSAVGINNSSYLGETYVDRSQIAKVGQRRSSSTGVIGDSINSSPALLTSLGLVTDSDSKGGRQVTKTLMDLIQEDYPDKPQAINSATLYANSTPIVQRDNKSYPLERPRTTSPLPSQRMQNDYDTYDGHMVRNGVYRSRDMGVISVNDSTNYLSDSMSRLNLGFDADNAYRMTAQARPIPQYAPAPIETSLPQDESQSSVYAPVAYHPRPTRPQPRSPGQHVQFDSQDPRYESPPQPQQVSAHLQTQVLPSGHTIYVNATSPPPSQYSYATIQYHPHPQQHHIVHQPLPRNIPPPDQQYVSVVPIQQGGGVPGHVQQVDPGGSYAYWQPPERSQAGHHAVTIMRPGLVQVKPSESHHQHKHKQRHTTASSHGGRGKDKGGKGRRSGSRNRSSGVGQNGGNSGGGDSKVTGAVHQSQSNATLLEDYKAKRNNRDWTVEDVKGSVVEFCKDQNGSRFIQQRLEIGSVIEKDIVMSEVIHDIVQLRNDVFGNYVIQKLLGFGTNKMKEVLRDTMIGEMVELSMQMYGCRVVQKALECVHESDLPKLLCEFQNNVLSLIHDQNGNHVIQKCIEVLSVKAKVALDENEGEKGIFLAEQIDFVIDDVLNNLATLACHPYGCRVLQRILEHCVKRQKSAALEEISGCLRTLFDDQYGNYVIQHVLQFGRVQDRDMVLDMVVENGLLRLSKQKFASNVIEKLLKYGNDKQRRSIVREMLKVVDEKTDNVVDDSKDGTSIVLIMVRDPYANYVVQTTLDVVPESDERDRLLKELNAHSLELKNYTFAKHIISKLDS